MSLLVDDAGAIRTISFSSPQKRNALSRDMLADLVREIGGGAAALAQKIRCTILRGDPAGGAFSSGFDITSIDDTERERGLDPIKEPADVIEASVAPVIAAIDGACMGGALEIAMACTMRIAQRSAFFAMPPAKLGLVYSSTGLVRFLRAISASRAQRLFLTGERIDADTALAWGLVDAVVEDAGAEAARIAGVIAQNAPLAVAGLLDAIRRCARPGGLRVDDIAAIDAARARTIASDDLQEGVRAFAEKRAPVFRGQ